MSGQWKPGDVALVRPIYCDHPDVIAVRTGVPPNMGWSYSMRTSDGSSTRTWASDPDGLTVVRRLVVIDPEDREQVERLRQTMSLLGYERGDCAEDLQAVIRAMIAPPKPDEPTGLGAVVEDAVGEWWVQFTSKTGKWWRNHQGVNRRWSDLNAAKVLSEGVTP